ncbi:MAG: hypothetical protein C4535_06870 [Comamonadaceae bacterium]|nr:MAG: hypothetical protein C4535_06870 [Comamonadaceae bacterium]
MPQTSDHTPVQPDGAFVELGAGDLTAIVAHLQSLDERDFHLRFGSGLRTPDALQRTAQGLLQRASVFGLWDAGHTRLLVLGSHGRSTSASAPDSVELGLSALPEVRGGVSQRVATWLLPRFVAAKYKQVEVLFYAANQPVARLAASMGMKVSCSQGECVAHLDLKPTADAIRDWLDRLEQLLAAVRNEPPASAGAKL